MLPLALSTRAGADTYARRLSAAASLIGRSTERYPHHGGGPAMGGDRAPATGGDRAPATGGDRAPVSADRRVVSIAARGSASIGPMSSLGASRRIVTTAAGAPQAALAIRATRSPVIRTGSA
jgi:hypothetical protein